MTTKHARKIQYHQRPFRDHIIAERERWIKAHRDLEALLVQMTAKLEWMKKQESGWAFHEIGPPDHTKWIFVKER